MYSKKVTSIFIIVLILCCITPHIKADNNLDSTFKNNEKKEKIVVNNSDFNVTIYIDKINEAGKKINLDFFITNLKQQEVNEVNIKLDIYSYGVKIFSKTKPSWKQFKFNETVHISQNANLPLFTPPGCYKLKFSITPENMETEKINTQIQVNQTFFGYLIFGLIIMTFLVLALYLRKSILRFIGSIPMTLNSAKKIIQKKNKKLAKNVGKNIVFPLLILLFLTTVILTNLNINLIAISLFLTIIFTLVESKKMEGW